MINLFTKKNNYLTGLEEYYFNFNRDENVLMS